MIANEYGGADREISATHHEYRLAQELKLPTVVFIKSATNGGRLPQAKALIDEIKRDGFTYKRFRDREDLRSLMLEALRRMLAEAFAFQATPDEVAEGEQQMQAASPFASGQADAQRALCHTVAAALSDMAGSACGIE